MVDKKLNFTLGYSLGRIIAEYAGDWYCKHNPCGVHCTCWWGDKLGLCSDSCDWQPPLYYIMIREDPKPHSHNGYFIPPVHRISWIFEPLSNIQKARKKKGVNHKKRRKRWGKKK